MNTFSLVFSNPKYILLGGIIFVGLLIPLLILSEYLFFEPYVVGHIPKDTELGFSLIVILSGLAALVLPMNVYRINFLRHSKKKLGGGVFGSIVGAAAGACGCGPVGFAIISTFGSIGSVASSFLITYEIPIRMAAICILVLSYFTTIRSLKVECKINSDN
ncbi:hypothetical protein C6988_07410 [Nitrosopumilus sp. b1]|uniref:hypothetical protein n=1 Tax=Nitrosopumilus sp. b1 TaxID=2109907 RepID=UPI001C7151F0|nr:hypothetical protein [Nitrosopumilus sp. b1]KAF6242501.1 hypothetical protein C6988_07410 [Nitrosopumilus sp. b1]